MNPVIIAIDGEASTGKSTQAKKIAEKFDYNYRDSGAYYRAITLYLIQNNINSNCFGSNGKLQISLLGLISFYFIVFI